MSKDHNYKLYLEDVHFSRSIAKNTLVFFGIDPEEQIQQQKWRERRMRHCSKRYGGLKDDSGTEDFVDGGTPRRSIVSAGPMMKSRLTKRESVPSMVFNGLKRRLSTKVCPQMIHLCIVEFEATLF